MSAEDLAYRVARRFTAAERVASRYFERKYALDLNRMTVPEAKKILGLPAGAVTKEDLNKAYRSKAIENHPDRGGDHMKMVEINVAKDKVLKDLEGGGSGKWAPPSWDTGAVPPEWQSARPRPPKWQDDPETKIVEGQSFAQAWSGSGAPPNTEWKFISNPTYSWKQGQPTQTIYVMYGTTETKHVFLAFKHRDESMGTSPTEKYGPKTHFNEDWQSSSVELPIGQPALKIIPKYIKSLATSWADGASPKPPTKFTAWPGGHPTEAIIKKILHHGGVALKDILVGTGVAQEGSPGVGDRKTQVKIISQYNKEKSKANRETLHAKKITHFSVIHQYDFFVRINGKEQILAQDTLEKMEKKFIPWVIGWDKIDDNRVFNLTKKRGGFLKMDAASSIMALVDCLTSEPSWVHIGLEKAAEEYESESKTASLFRIASEMSHEDAAKHVGLSSYDLFRAMLG